MTPVPAPPPATDPATDPALCALPGCARHVPPQHMLCRPDWARVPASQQRGIYRAWRSGNRAGALQMALAALGITPGPAPGPGPGEEPAEVRIVGTPAQVTALASRIGHVADVVHQSRLIPRREEPGRVTLYLRAASD